MLKPIACIFVAAANQKLPLKLDIGEPRIVLSGIALESEVQINEMLNVNKALESRNYFKWCTIAGDVTFTLYIS